MIVYWLCYITCIGAFAYFGHGFVSQMFENIATEPVALAVVILIAFLPTLAWAICARWSAYTDHRKAHANDEETEAKKEIVDKFAFVPYLIIPAIFIIVSEAVALVAVSFVAGRYELSPEEVIGAVAIATLAIYLLVDHLLGSNLGNSAFYKMVEEKFYTKSVGVAKDLADKADVTEAIEAYLARGFTMEEAEALLLVKKKQQ